MAATCSTAVSQASCSRGSLLYMPLCAPSTSRAPCLHPKQALNIGLRAHVAPAATSRHAAPAVVTAAAVLECSKEGQQQCPPTLNPAIWLDNSLDAAAEWEPQPAANTNDSTLKGHNSRRRRNKSGQYLGVYESAEEPTTSATAGAQGQQKTAAQPDASSSIAQPNSSKSSRRRRPRGRPNTRAITRLKAQYSTLFEQLESEHTALLHKHEREFMQMMYSGATPQQLQEQQQRHDMILHKLQSKYSQKWGPPVTRRVFLQAWGPQHQQQQQHHQDQQQQQAADQPNGISSNSSGRRSVSSNKPQPRQQQQQTQQRQQAVAQTSARATPARPAPTRSSSSSNSSSRDTSVNLQPTYSVFDIPDDTPELLTAAAAAQDEAAAVQRFTNQMVGAKMIANALDQEPMDRDTLDGLEIVFLHLALPKLVAWKVTARMIKLTEYLLTRPDRDAHTYGAIFNAYALANRTDLALATWDKLSTAGVDIGPYGSSALIKACARQRDVGAALQVFDQLLRRRVTFNSYTYNCLLHLCCSAGRIDEALAVYNLQRLETNPQSLPDAYTYNALMRGVLVSGRVELTQQLFENMLEDGVTADPKLYLNFLNAAGRGGNLGLARYLYQHLLLTLDLGRSQQQQQQRQRQSGVSQQDGSPSSAGGGRVTDPAAAAVAGPLAAVLNPDPEADSDDDLDLEPNMLYIVNALLFAHAQVGALQGALAVYRQELLGRGLRPDAYTCTALLTAAARSAGTSLSWSDVHSVVDIMQQYDVAWTTQLGTALINAYRRVRVWQRPAAAAAAGSSDRQQQQGKRRRRSSSRSAAAGGGSSSSSDDEDRADQAPQQQQQQPLDEQQLFTATGAPSLPDVQPVIAAALHAAQQVLQKLQSQHIATSNSYVTILCFLLEQGQAGTFKQLYSTMQQQGIQPDDQGWEKLLYASEECGVQEHLLQLKHQQEVQQQRRLLAMRMGPQRARQQQQQQQQQRRQ